MKKRYFIEVVTYNHGGTLDILSRSATETKEKAVNIFMEFIKTAREDFPAADGVILSYGYNSESAEVVERWGRI